MATATSRRAPAKPKALAARRELAASLVDIESKIAPDIARIATIEVELKKIATELGQSFKEEFADEGQVSVTGAVGAEFKGDVPVIQTEAFLALKAAERKQLVKRGIVKIEPQWGKASNGRVTVKLF